MHEIPSLALAVLGYTSPLDYSHLNLWIMWGRPSEQKKMVFPSANKIFSHLSVGIWMHSHCRGVPYNFCFADCPRQFPCSANAGRLHARAVWSGRAQQAGRDSRAPLPITGRWIWPWLQTYRQILPHSTVQCQCPVSESSLRRPRSEAVTTSASGKHLHSLFWPCLCLWRKIIWQQHSTVKSSLVSALCAFPGNSRSWDRNRFHPHWHSMSNLAACSPLTYFNNNGHSNSPRLGAAILC